ncbi:unnamed protein product [Clavelina lepadiformis]|uniref:CUB domain-containing protein n=1 Tax=Clavelina lepadiformis TaxID=159417 RepID=A0ABP0G5T8_CLALP
MNIERIFRPESTIKPLTIECIDEYASHIQQPTGGNTVGPVTEISCLHRNTTLRRQYEDCFTLSLQEEKDRQQFEVESVVGFVEDHWPCDSLTSRVTPASWLRRMTTFTEPNTPLRRILMDCNAKVFPCASAEECWHVLKANGTQTHVMTSQGYPKQLHDVDCSYEFQAQLGFTLEITVELDIEECCDFLEVTSENDKLIAKLSGNVKRTFRSYPGESFIYMEYHTDENIGGKGFRASWRNVCEYKRVASARHYSPKLYPPFYGYASQDTLPTFDKELECTWVVTASPGEQVLLVFEEIYMNTCCDKLTIHDGRIDLGNFALTNARGVPIRSQHGMLTLRYQTNSTVYGNGFLANYGTATRRAPCGNARNASDAWQHFSTGKLTKKGNKALRCFWQITASEGYAVVVNISSIVTAKPSFHRQKVQVFDGLSALQSFFNESHMYVSSKSNLAIQLLSHEWRTFGLRASYRQLPCNVTYNLTGSASMKLASPDYKGFPFNIYQRCTYTLHAQPGKKIRMTLKTFTKTGFVEIKSGHVNLGRVTGLQKTIHLTSSGSTLQLHYTAARAKTAKTRGFIATYRQFTPQCGMVLIANSSSQVFLSPGYPNMENTNCEWIITAATKMNVMLNLVDFEMDTTSALFVFDQMLSLGKYTGSGSNVTLVSSADVLRLRFRNKGSASGHRRFLATFKEVANSGWNARLVPGNMSGSSYMRCSSQHCSGEQDNFWNFQAEKYYKHVELIVTQASLQTSDSFLQIMDDTKIVVKLHGNHSFPQTIKSSTSVLRVYFHSNFGFPKDTFTAEVKTICVEDYAVGPSTQLIYFPDINSNKLIVDCKYNFITETGSRIELTVTDKTKIRNDIVKILEGNETLYSLEGYYQHSLSDQTSYYNTTVRSTGNKLTLHRVTFIRSPSEGFVAQYKNV